MQFNAIFERDGEWWVATAVEISGSFSQGKTLEEARANLLDAVRELILAQREQPNPNPDDPSSAEN